MLRYSDEVADVNQAGLALLPPPDVSGAEWAAGALEELTEVLHTPPGLSPVQLRNAKKLRQALRKASRPTLPRV